MYLSRTVGVLAMLVVGVAMTMEANAVMVSIDTHKDAGVYSDGTTSNGDLGTSGVLNYRYLVSGPTIRNERIYVSFNLPNDIDTIEDASIELFKKYSSTGKTVKLYGITDESLDAWDESTISFDDGVAYADSSATTQNPDATKTTLIASYLVSNAQSTTTTLGDTGGSLSSFLATDTNGVVSFLLVDFDNSFTTGNFASREGTDTGDFAPRLILDYTPVPEPASLALLAVGGVLLCSRRMTKRSVA